MELPPPPIQVEYWDIKRADWNLFQEVYEEAIHSQNEPEDLDDCEKNIITCLRFAADAAIPKKKMPHKRRKEYWFYNEEVKILNNNLNRLRRHYRKTRDPEDLNCMLIYRDHVTQRKQQIKSEKWFEWCNTFNAHTTLGELWGYLKRAMGGKERPPYDENATETANAIMEGFAKRSSSAQLPVNVKNKQRELKKRAREKIPTSY